MRVSGTLPVWVTLDATGKVTEVEVNCASEMYRVSEVFNDDLTDVTVGGPVELDAVIAKTESTIQDADWPGPLIILDHRRQHQL
jgi:hypothetical protein